MGAEFAARVLIRILTEFMQNPIFATFTKYIFRRFFHLKS